MTQNDYAEFLEKTKKIYLINSILELLYWDIETYMPKNEINAKSMQINLLAQIAYDEMTSKELGKLIKKINPKKLNKDERCNYLEIKKYYNREIKVPKKLVLKLKDATVKATESWKNARDKNDFKIFEKDLERVIKLKGERAKKINPEKNPYEVLFEDYEEDIPYKDAKKLIMNTYRELESLIKKTDIKNKKESREIDRRIQKEVLLKILKDINYDFKKGRIDKSRHPFTTNPSFGRITTRYSDGWLQALLSTIHEAGHALYEQGLPLEYYATPRGASKGMSIHESQSRIWENHVGRSKEFWAHYYKEIKKKYELKDTLKEFLKKRYTAKRDYIRVNADELTYIAHIIIRMEIEEALINKKLKVRDAKKKWNELTEKYLGLKPSNDNEGILQDIHWASGDFGYFPTYLLGSIIAAQLFHYANKNMKLEKKFKEGKFKDLLTWLRENIHEHGRKYTAQELVLKATGENITNKHFIKHINERYEKHEKKNKKRK
jgi:carboxypeptidase Taq